MTTPRPRRPERHLRRMQQPRYRPQRTIEPHSAVETRRENRALVRRSR